MLNRAEVIFESRKGGYRIFVFNNNHDYPARYLQKGGDLLEWVQYYFNSYRFAVAELKRKFPTTRKVEKYDNDVVLFKMV